MDLAQISSATKSPAVMFFSESRYAGDQPPKQHRGPIFGMIGTRTFGAGDRFDQIPNIGSQAPLKIIAAFRK